MFLRQYQGKKHHSYVFIELSTPNDVSLHSIEERSLKYSGFTTPPIKHQLQIIHSLIYV